MPAVHLHVVELKRNRQTCCEQPFAILAPHHHGVAELGGVLVDDTVELCLYHGRGADDHVVFESDAAAFIRRLGGQCLVVVAELPEVGSEGYVARVDAAVAVGYNYVDGQAVVAVELSPFRQGVELLDAARRLADAPTHQHGEFHVVLPAEADQTADVHRLHQCHHRHGRCHPQAECVGAAALLGLYLVFHLLFLFFLKMQKYNFSFIQTKKGFNVLSFSTILSDLL